MTDRIREQMSALLDGELPRDEMGLLVRRLERDEHLRRAFGNYVLAGEALRSPSGPLASAGFAARVSAAIDAGTVDATPVPVAQPERARWVRPTLATAVAASAAVVAVLLVKPAVQETAVVAGGAVQQAQRAFALASLPIVAESSPTPAHSQRLAGYLMAHSQFAGAIGRRNVWSSVLASDPGITRVSYEFAETP
jgi:sigma-E factor negative regulatory protein RseA